MYCEKIWHKAIYDTLFDIRDKETAERFVKALEESENGPEWKPIAPVKPPLTDKNAILELWAKRERNA